MEHQFLSRVFSYPLYFVDKFQEVSYIALTIKQKAFDQILSSIKSGEINFDAEGGCACGRLEIKLNEQLYMSGYRSCRKSSSTPDNKWLHIDGFDFHTESYDIFDEDGESNFEIINLQLNKEQEQELIAALKELTIESWGTEFR